MDPGIILENLLTPPILFFALGMTAGILKSDLAIPEAVTKLLSLYLMWAIGIKGGVQLRASGFTPEAILALSAAMGLAIVVPTYVFALLRSRLGTENAAALCGVYGSVSAVTFLTACSFLQRAGVAFGGHMVAALALMESPAILMAIALSRAGRSQAGASGKTGVESHAGSLVEHVREAALNGPVVLLTGSMVIGAVTGERGYQALKPLCQDLFQGVLAFFLLELGLLAARRVRVLKVVGWPLVAFGVIVPLFNASMGLLLARVLRLSAGDAFLLTVLAASASYIAAPAALRHSIPRANAGLYVPLALAVTFPFNIAIGMPLYWAIISWWWGSLA